MNLRMLQRVCILILFAGVAYVLSYPPAVTIAERLHLIRRGVFDGVDGDKLPVYKPVDWLIDHSVVRKPILAWAWCWGQYDNFELGSIYRTSASSEWIDIT